ncbi:MAG: hypothetical protein LBG06_05095 [Deltaproteobacteria bacterium]|jgi:malate/lactate dehydrogenase|nr:hypothetical protein [Deltaproteobacteria bacterium]
MADHSRKPSKLTIIGGAGGLGSAIAFHVGLSGLFDEIVLIDPARNVLATHEIDLRECFVGETSTRVRSGLWADSSGSDVVLMCTSRTGAQVESRNDYLHANLALVLEAAENLNRHAADSFLVVATVPLDVFVMLFADRLGWPRHRILGYTYNDSHRFRWILGKALGLDPARVRGVVLGEHGEGQVPVFSSVTVDGEPRVLESSERDEAASLLGLWYPCWQQHNAGRTTTWSSAVGMCRTLQALRGGGPEPLMGSVVLEGEYGHSGVALGVPLKPAADGASWAEVVELPLEQEERAAFDQAARDVRALYLKAKGAKEADGDK